MTKGCRVVNQYSVFRRIQSMTHFEWCCLYERSRKFDNRGIAEMLLGYHSKDSFNMVSTRRGRVDDDAYNGSALRSCTK